MAIVVKLNEFANGIVDRILFTILQFVVPREHYKAE